MRTILGLLSLAWASSASAQAIVGLPQAEWPSSGRSEFTCRDGSRTLPASYLNDDYCDCEDGSDEPGTSACPGARFYCPNVGFRPEYVRSGKVNDGICDCCDGSDEHSSRASCPNHCAASGATAYGAAQERFKAVNYALDSVRSWSSQAIASRTEWEREVASLKEQVTAAKATRDSAEETKRVAEEKEGKLREERDKEEEAKKAAEEAAQKAAAGDPASGVGKANPNDFDHASEEDGTCVSWRQTGGCDPEGARESMADKTCNEFIHQGAPSPPPRPHPARPHPARPLSRPVQPPSLGPPNPSPALISPPLRPSYCTLSALGPVQGVRTGAAEL